MQAKRILVSGGAGFIGSNLCGRLVVMGHDVLCVDNYYTGSKNNIEHLLGASNFKALQHDVTAPLFVEVDEIYNLACPASPIQYKVDPIQTLKTSVLGAWNMLGLAKRTGARVLQASTSEIYGDPQIHPQHESYFGNVNVCGPRACYDEGKRTAETLFYDYRRQHGVRTKVVRIFNTYGPRMQENDGRVISNFIVQALRGHPLTISGDGMQTRSFCFVDDLVDGLMAVMDTPDEFGGPVNIGNPEEVTIADVAGRIAAMTGSQTTMRQIERTEDDPNRRCPDISLMRSVTGWTPRVSLNEGLVATIDYFRKELERSRAPLKRVNK